MSGLTLSDGVIIAVVTTLGGIVVAWIKTRKSKALDPIPPGPAVGQPAIVATLPLRSVPQVAEKLSKPSRPPVSPLAVTEIVAVFKNTPPFHHDKIKANYVGVRVRWEALLSSIYESSDGSMSVSADTVDYHYLSCKAHREDVLSLLNAPDRTPVIIEGTLTSFGLGHADLRDCVIGLKSTPV